MARLKAKMIVELDYDADPATYGVETPSAAATLDENVFREDPASLVQWVLDELDSGNVDDAHLSVKVSVIEAQEE